MVSFKPRHRSQLDGFCCPDLDAQHDLLGMASESPSAGVRDHMSLLPQLSVPAQPHAAWQNNLSAQADALWSC